MREKWQWSDKVQTAYFQKAVSLYYKNHFAKAILFLSNAIDIDLNYDDAYYFRGLSFERKGDIASALSDYGRALSIERGIEGYFATYSSAFNIDPRHSFINYRNSNGCSWWEQAVSDYTRPIEIAEREALFYCKEGRTCNVNGDLTQSIIMYSKALEIDSLNAFALFQRADVWNSLGNHERAISDYSKVLNLNPTFARGYYKRGQIYFKKSEYNKAYDDFNKSKTLGYKHPQFLEKLEYLVG